MPVMEGVPAFAATFAMLMWFWTTHYTFIRRYGLEDRWTRFLNCVVLLLVVFMVYPLKFLLSSAFASYFGLGEALFELNSIEDLSQLYILYGLGLGSVWFCYFLLYRHAHNMRKTLRLNETEEILTRGKLCETPANMAVCLTSISLALFNTFSWQLGMVYTLIGPLMGFIGWWHGSKAEKSHLAHQKQRRRRS